MQLVPRCAASEITYGLNPPEKQEDDYGEHDQTDAAGRVVAPLATVRPGRQGAHQEKNENDEKNCSKHDTYVLRVSETVQIGHDVVDLLARETEIGHRRMG